MVSHGDRHQAKTHFLILRCFRMLVVRTTKCPIRPSALRPRRYEALCCFGFHVECGCQSVLVNLHNSSGLGIKHHQAHLASRGLLQLKVTSHSAASTLLTLPGLAGEENIAEPSDFAVTCPTFSTWHGDLMGSPAVVSDAARPELGQFLRATCNYSEGEPRLSSAQPGAPRGARVLHPAHPNRGPRAVRAAASPRPAAPAPNCRGLAEGPKAAAGESSGCAP